MEPKKNLPKLTMQPLPLREEQPRKRSDLPQRRTAYVRGRAYRSRYAGNLGTVRRRAGQTGSFALQSLVCSMVFLMVIALQRLNVPVGEGLLNGLSFVVSENRDLTGSVPQDWLEEAMTVFSPGGASDLSHPAAGEGTKTEKGWTIYQQPGELRAVMDGTVFYIGQRENGRNYTRLRHSGGFESWYEGISLDVAVGQELRAGEILGRLAEGETLYFCLRQDGIIVDHTSLGGG